METVSTRNAVIEQAEIEIDPDLFGAPGVRVVVVYEEGSTQQLPFRGSTLYYIRRLLEVAGVLKFSDLVGRSVMVRVRENHGLGTEIIAIGHFISDDFLELSDLDGRRDG